MKIEFKQLPIEFLQRGRFQPRRDFDENALQELAQSIQSQGLIEPLIVRLLGAQSYEIIAGERRWRAATMAGLTSVSCLITPYSDEQAAAITLIENIQREDLNVMEEAEGYEKLAHEFGFRQEDIAQLIGKSRSHVANLLRILTLSPNIQKALRNHTLSYGHARVLVGLSHEQQEKLMQLTITEQWSVRKLEEVVRTAKWSKPVPSKPESNRDIGRLEIQLAEQIGAPVEISTDEKQGGWLKIRFFDATTLEGLLERMGLRYDECF